MKRTISVAILFLLASATVGAQSAVLVESDTTAQHLIKYSQPIYPPIAIAAQIYGTVRLLAVVDQKGHVPSAQVLSGPAMLREAAIDNVRHYRSTPFGSDAKPVGVTVMVNVNFLANGRTRIDFPSKEGDDNSLNEFLRAFDRCNRESVEVAPGAEQVKSCKQAAQRADAFVSSTYLYTCTLAYVQYATALIRDGKTADAVEVGNKAIAVAKGGPHNLSGVSAAYGVRGEALASAGNLAAADEDLIEAEKWERKELQMFPRMLPVDAEDSRVLKGLLQFHAKVLSEMEKQKEAKSELKQAAKL